MVKHRLYIYFVNNNKKCLFQSEESKCEQTAMAAARFNMVDKRFGFSIRSFKKGGNQIHYK